MPLYQPSSFIVVLLLAASAASAAEALDAADESFRAASYAQAWAGPLNADHAWSNPASGHGGRVRAIRERLDPASRQPCREIQEDVTAGDRPATGYAVGCRGTDGVWRIVQSSAGAATSAGTIVPADVTPYAAPADIDAAGSGGAGDLSGLPPQVRILVPWHGAAGAAPPAPR